MQLLMAFSGGDHELGGKSLGLSNVIVHNHAESTVRF